MMRTPISSLLAALSLLAASCSSFSANAPAFAAGTYRLGGDANLNFQDNEFNGTDTDTLGGNVDLGRFFTANLELGLRGSYSETDNGTVETDSSSLAAFGRWYTGTKSDTRPWVEIGGGVGSMDDGAVDVSGTILFFAIGVSRFLTESVAGEVFGRQSVGDFDDGIESDTLDLGIGFSFFW